MPNIVEANQLVKQYPGNPEPSVRGLSFAIQQGEIFGFLGPNGAGKTTTISMLSCLLKPTEGSATIAGFDLIHQSSNVKRQIGLVPQDLALYPTLSARDNLSFFGRIYRLKGSELRQRVNDALEMVELSDRANDAVETFSGGMKRRVNIAAGLLHRPQVLFFDEPTVGVDPQSRNFIFENVEALNRDGMTVLYTTHYMEEAQELSDRVGIIDHGQLIALGTQKELTKIVGEYDTLRLHIGDEDDAQKLAQALCDIPGVVKCSAADHQVVLVAHEAEEALAPAVTRANEAGIRIHSVDIQEPNLETVFLQLTGRALRD